MYRLNRVATKELPAIIKDLSWLGDDSRESMMLVGWDIPVVILKQQRTDPINFVVTRNDEVLSVIIIDIDGSLTYFNTMEMRTHTLSYLRFLKPHLDAYVKLFDIELVVGVASWYTTSIKKLKLLGFELKRDNIDRVEYGKSYKED